MFFLLLKALAIQRATKLIMLNITCSKEEGKGTQPQLHNDMVEVILRKLPKEDLISAGLTCPDWRDITKSPSLWIDEVCPIIIKQASAALSSYVSATGNLSGMAQQQGQERVAVSGKALLAVSIGGEGPLELRATTDQTLNLPGLWLAFHGRNFLANPHFLPGGGNARYLGTGLGSRSFLDGWRSEAWVRQRSK